MTEPATVDGEVDEDWRPVVSLSAFGHYLAGVEEPDADTWESDTPNLVSATAISVALGVAGFGVAFLETAVSPPSGPLIYTVSRSQLEAGRSPACSALIDPTYWVFLLLACATCILYAIQLRQCDRLFARYPSGPLSPEQRDGLAEALKTYRTRLKYWGSWKRTVGLIFVALALSAVAIVFAESHGPLPTLMDWLVGASSRDLTRGWWLNPSVQPFSFVLWTIALTLLFYVWLRQLLLLLLTGCAVKRIRDLDATINVDVSNADGSYGLGLIRGCLVSLTFTGMAATVACSVYFLLMVGDSALAIAMPAAVAVGSSLAVWVAMAVVSRGVQKGKRAARSNRMLKLNSMTNELKAYREPVSHDELWVASDGSRVAPWGPAKARDAGGARSIDMQRFVLYREQLVNECVLIDAIPSTGFRIREFIAASATLVGVPIVVAVLTSWTT